MAIMDRSPAGLEHAGDAQTAESRRDDDIDAAGYAPVGHLLRRVYHDARDTSANLYRDFDATPQQAAALFAIRRAGALSQAQIGEAIAMEPANVHGLVGRLKNKGLIETGRDPADPRRMRVRLTRQGEAITAKLAEAAKHSEETTLRALSTRERANLISLLKKMIRAGSA